MYRIELVPRGVWIISVIGALLIILLAFSVAMTNSRGQVTIIGPEVQTGDPADYVKQPTPPPPTASPTEIPPPAAGKQVNSKQ